MDPLEESEFTEEELSPHEGAAPEDEQRELERLARLFSRPTRLLLRRAAARLGPRFLYAGLPIMRDAIEHRNNELKELYDSRREL